MAILSYAQNFEDVLLARAFPEAEGFYIDVGAADPVSHSVTKLFYQRGWRGINLEPHAGFFQRLTNDRTRDVNLNAAVTDTSGKVDYYEVPTNIGWATVSTEQVERLTAQGVEVTPRPVPAVTLDEVWDEHVTGTVDFLKVDVEGAEREVLLGLDLTRHRPRVILLEAIEPGTNRLNYDSWEHLLLDRDYLFAHFDGVNRYYVRAEDRQLLPALLPPVSCLDQAVRFEDAERVRQAEARLRTTEVELRAALDGQRVAEEQLRQLRLSTVSRQAYDALKQFLDQTREHVTTLHGVTFAHTPPPEGRP